MFKTKPILTLDADISNILLQKTTDIDLDSNTDMSEALYIIEKLKATIQPLMPAAGLAAPQIGESKSIFIFSWDRSLEHLESAINPSYILLNEEQEIRWEGCFSVILGSAPHRIACIPRYTKIKASYYNEEGKLVNQILTNFAAKVFQHECDHLKGIVNVNREDAKIKAFDSTEELLHFMGEVKLSDNVQYIEPESCD